MAGARKIRIEKRASEALSGTREEPLSLVSSSIFSHRFSLTALLMVALWIGKREAAGSLALALNNEKLKLSLLCIVPRSCEILAANVLQTMNLIAAQIIPFSWLNVHLSAVSIPNKLYGSLGDHLVKLIIIIIFVYFHHSQISLNYR